MKKIYLITSALIFLIVILILTHKAWLPLPGTFLLVKDDIGKADCIVPLAGDEYRRFRKTAELYDNGYSKNVVVSVRPARERRFDEYEFRLRLLGLKDMSEMEFAAKGLEHFGIDDKDIYFTMQEVTSTYDEAVATKQIMTKRGFESLMLVTSTYHTRRVLMIFKLVFRSTGIRIYNCTARNELYDPYRWWRKERDVKAIGQEYLSIIYNLFYHFILRQGRTSFDTF